MTPPAKKLTPFDATYTVTIDQPFAYNTDDPHDASKDHAYGSLDPVDRSKDLVAVGTVHPSDEFTYVYLVKYYNLLQDGPPIQQTLDPAADHIRTTWRVVIPHASFQDTTRTYAVRAVRKFFLTDGTPDFNQAEQGISFSS